MSVRITCINKDHGNHSDPHMGITDLGWKNETTGETGKSTRAAMIEWLEKAGNGAYVKDRYGDIAWLEIMVRNNVKYVRTIPDQTKADNLLTLSECLR